MFRRFEGKNRFWEIRRLDEVSVQTRSGVIGTDGKQSERKYYETGAKADKDVEKKIAEQLAKDFVEITQSIEPEPANPQLEGQIIEEPTDPGRCLVFADWLQGQGHPRGELGVLQAQRAERTDDIHLAKAEQKLFEKHPELAPTRVIEATKKQRKTGESDERTTITWENGFIAAARIARKSD